VADIKSGELLITELADGQLKSNVI